MRFIWHLILIFFIFIKLSVAQKLLLLFLDGFRWDYIKETDLGGFLDIKKKGAYIEKVIPVFPADCHPNIYSIFTGLYPQHHGVLGNQVYSSKLKRKFDHTNPVHRRDVHEWVDAEPLWVTSKNQGKQSFLYHLPTCESSFGPLSPSYCVPYHLDYMTMEAFNMSVKEALRSLKSGVANMAVVYNDQLDRITHQFGPESSTLTENLLPRIGRVIKWLLGNLERDTHLVVLSDHGMAQIARHRQIYLERMILRSEIERVINQGGYVGIWAHHGMLNRVKLRLTLASQADGHFNLYTRTTMPPHWNVGAADDLVPDLLMVAQPGFFIASDELNYPSGDNFYDSGWHGYAPEHEEMASPLLAFGPRMQAGKNIDMVHVTDIYQFLAYLLDISPLSHNGSSAFLDSLLQESPVKSRLKIVKNYATIHQIRTYLLFHIAMLGTIVTM